VGAAFFFVVVFFRARRAGACATGSSAVVSSAAGGATEAGAALFRARRDLAAAGAGSGRVGSVVFGWSSCCMRDAPVGPACGARAGESALAHHGRNSVGRRHPVGCGGEACCRRRPPRWASAGFVESTALAGPGRAASRSGSNGSPTVPAWSSSGPCASRVAKDDWSGARSATRRRPARTSSGRTVGVPCRTTTVSIAHGGSEYSPTTASRTTRRRASRVLTPAFVGRSTSTDDASTNARMAVDTAPGAVVESRTSHSDVTRSTSEPARASTTSRIRAWQTGSAAVAPPASGRHAGPASTPAPLVLRRWMLHCRRPSRGRTVG
jgi:hypothetical protein